ncbi:MAG TPA: hypothetical protein VD862_03700 [Candidatus Paceibacterota bacterium]|nr:hypothetical protein [Candidatus Paceibacterota bacterium]
MRFCYFAGDVEGSVGGPPGTPYVLPPRSSMVSFGLVAIGDPSKRFYAELQELTEPETGWNTESEKIHGLSREHLRLNGMQPWAAMDASRTWVNAVAGDAIPVYCAMPVAYDFRYMDWYYRHTRITNPFLKTLDGREFYRRLRGLRTDERVERSRIWAEFPTTMPHTHNALDDALEYAEVFGQMLREAGML